MAGMAATSAAASISENGNEMKTQHLGGVENENNKQ